MAEPRDLNHAARSVDGAGQQHPNIADGENVTADDPSTATRDAAAGAARVFGDTELTDTAQRLRRTSGVDAHAGGGTRQGRTKDDDGGPTADDDSDDSPLT